MIHTCECGVESFNVSFCYQGDRETVTEESIGVIHLLHESYIELGER